MSLNTLKPVPGSVKKRKTVGRGAGSGHGKTSCRGGKGQTARSGGKVSPHFEGGQMPLTRRMPKRGFSNFLFTTEYAIINTSTLNKFDGKDEITPEFLVAKGVVPVGCPVKILGNGDLDKVLVVKVHKFSKSAVDKIVKAGGKAEVLA